MKLTRPDGTRLHYETHGSGQPLLCFGGLIAPISLTREKLLPLLGDAFQLILVSYRGHEDTEFTAPFSLSDLLDDAVAVLDALDVDQTDVFGDAFGATLAALLAVTHPQRVRRVAVCSIAAAPDPRLRWRIQAWYKLMKYASFELLMDAVIPDLFGRKFLLEQRQHVVAMTRRWVERKKPEDLLQLFEASIRHRGGDVSTLQQPLLILQGNDDLIIPPEHGRAFMALLPHAEYVELDSGHAVMEEVAAPIARALRRFLSA
ncbi:MAG TPA: alpha/beta hydrolase [Rhodocyclaceae bacterium]|nr:alpha/beta hydrolase [Rhodocyclaceae bacterium]